MSTGKCSHGYFTHSPYNKCPWCFGWDRHNKGSIPMHGKGNGWLLKKGEPVCQSCGGPSNAGWGVLPPDMTQEQWKTHRHTIKTCYTCDLAKLQDPYAKAVRRSQEAARPLNLGGGHYESIRTHSSTPKFG